MAKHSKGSALHGGNKISKQQSAPNNYKNTNNRETTHTTKHTSNNNGSSAMGGGVSIDAYQSNFWNKYIYSYIQT